MINDQMAVEPKPFVMPLCEHTSSTETITQGTAELIQAFILRARRHVKRILCSWLHTAADCGREECTGEAYIVEYVH